MQEKVLVADASMFHKRELGGKQFMFMTKEQLVNVLTGKNENARLGFMDRDKAETNEGVMQIIPYCVIRNGSKILRYKRTSKGGETRLHNKYSVGVGGHVNLEDDPNHLFSYMTGAVREVLEELGLKIDRNRLMNGFVGVILDYTTDVGRVHAGFMHVIDLEGDEAEAIMLGNHEDTMSDLEFIETKDLAELEEIEIESWSETAIKALTIENDKTGTEVLPQFVERATVMASICSKLACELALSTIGNTNARDLFEHSSQETFKMLFSMVKLMMIAGDISKDLVSNALTGPGDENIVHLLTEQPDKLIDIFKKGLASFNDESK